MASMKKLFENTPKSAILTSVLFAIAPPFMDDYNKYYFDDMSWFLLLFPCFVFSYFLGFKGGLYAAMIVNIYHLGWFFIGRYTQNIEFLREAWSLHIGVVVITFLCSVGTGILSSKLKKQHVQLQEMNEQLKHIALYDSLTGLPNRSYFMERLKDVLKDKRRSPVALLFIDLDGFKRVNDSFGHEEGDRLLKEVAAKLKTSVDDSAFASRLGGDEFVVLMNGADKDSLRMKANDLLRALQIKIHDVSISACIGIAFFQTEDTPSSFLNNADMAMYKAKSAGKNAIFFYDDVIREDVS